MVRSRARWPALPCSGRPAWTTRVRSAPWELLPAMSGRFWRKADLRVATSTGDYYQMLGISRESTPEEIKKAYRRHARTLHPDVNPDPEAQEQFKALTTAYEVLSDPQKREMYDLGGDPFGGASQGASGFGNFGGLGDIMDAFFGGGGGTRGPRSRVRQGADALLAIELDLHETAFGVDKEITVETAAVCELWTGSGTA